MQVLEAGQVAAGDDQVHALLVRDVEVAHGLAVVVDDPERERLLAAAAQLGLRDRDAQAAVGDGEAVDLGLAARMVATVNCGVRSVPAHRGVVAARIGIDHLARQRAGSEQDGQHAEEHRQLFRDRVHGEARNTVAGYRSRTIAYTP